VDYLGGLVLSDTPTNQADGLATTLAAFRRDFYQCLNRRADALFELAEAVLCADGPVTSLVGLSTAAEHRRSHGALYDAVNAGRIDVARLRVSLVGLPLPRMTDGRIVPAVDVSSWLRPDAATSPDRLFCHVYGRGKGQAQLIPGWPYSFVAAVQPGRTSWTAILDGSAPPTTPRPSPPSSCGPWSTGWSPPGTGTPAIQTS
jgi:DDE superfamily endonuclease